MRGASFIAAGLLVGVSACAAGTGASSTERGAPPPIVATSPDGPLVLINGAPLAMGRTIDEINPRSIVSVEVLKGDAARPFGPAAARGVIMIALSDSALAARLTRP
jgi:outer membrane receptor protein involved in Fe transport